MKAFVPYLAFSVVIQLSAANLSKAQTTSSLAAPPQNISVDGSAKEWGDSLRYYNTEKHINYSLANTKDTLYMAVRVIDRSEQTRILRAGITFSINTKGKKKETYSITFPLATNGGTPLTNTQIGNGDDSKQDHDALMQTMLTILRGIKATGFKDIEDEMITTSNTYGIKTAVDYDDKGYLVCEAAIPIQLFHADDALKNEWAFNIKLNGLTKPAQSENHEGGEGRGSRGGGGGFGGGGRGGRGGGRSRGGNFGSSGGGGADRSALFTSEDFWEKFYLAK